ncbi:cell wall synthesis protein CwsA [Mycobacterium sp.]|uniref:cell wall synthesis protein CwsA n=1 Tax=Mycobacterium sp. TaxID=1785 RepID=UPI00126DD2FE|nr:cell wall synthesis protein CwsA [Mycobacterium sp.]KAA8954589.1 MAG: cell wall synthesis protein CwsA [Mycobacterium sp.]
MTATNHTRLTPRQRLTRGLAYSAVGPVDLTRGLVGLGVNSAQAGVSSLRRRYRDRRLAADLQSAQETVAAELAAAHELVAGLPRALHKARQSRRYGRRAWVITGIVVVALGGGAVAFSILRRSARPNNSPRPPSVDVQQQL